MKGQMILILSDIHGNLEALKAVLYKEDLTNVSGIILLGDLIDYGPHSNEVIQLLMDELPEEKILINLWGNHENAILTETFAGFSSQRGIESAKYTSSILNCKSRDYLEKLEPSGIKPFRLGVKKCLAVHGSLDNTLWTSIFPENIHGNYKEYDYVFSGHSHYPHCFDVFYENEDPAYRNKKRVLFLNPGSVGQPRDHSPYASYALMDLKTEEVQLKKVPYDVKKTIKHFSDQVDEFYKTRLKRGI